MPSFANLRLRRHVFKSHHHAKSRCGTDFIPYGKLEPNPRPSRFEGQRTKTAFQVDRAKYDDILLRRAATLGCEVRQGTKVTRVRSNGDRTEALENRLY